MTASPGALARRRVLLEMTQRRIRPGSGSGEDFLRSRTWEESSAMNQRFTTPFVIVGAVATRMYTVFRQTEDIDILVRLADLPAIGAEIVVAGGTLLGSLSIGGQSWMVPEIGRIDVIALDEAWVEIALTHPVLAPDGMPVIDLPYLVLMKLDASRAYDLGDIQRMLGQASVDDLNRVRAVIRRWRPDDQDDLESMIVLGQMEFQSGG